MKFSGKRREILALGLFSISAFPAGIAWGRSRKAISEICDFQVEPSIDNVPRWREIQDYPDGRPIPKFLMEMTKDDGGIRPPKALVHL